MYSMINLIYIFIILLVLVAFAQIRKTYYYSSVIFGKKPPFWVVYSGKTLKFIENLVFLQIFDKK